MYDIQHREFSGPRSLLRKQWGLMCQEAQKRHIQVIQEAYNAHTGHFKAANDRTCKPRPQGTKGMIEIKYSHKNRKQ